ncbi:MAG: ATP:cob(I)alamin adenosyltransferase [Nitrospira sp.]|nr:MAG: ATP:cob(I)alamin adenosyltransferase [Nitrospira sp.]
MKQEALMPITEVMPKPATRENSFGRRATVKGNVRVEAYGDVDELNSTIGVVRAFNAELLENHPSADRWEEALRWMQVCVCSWGEKSLWIRLSYGS